MKKRMIILLGCITGLILTVFAVPEEPCAYPQQYIADSDTWVIYYECDDNLVPVQYECPSGLYFDFDEMYCTWPYEVIEKFGDKFGQIYCRCKNYGCYAGNFISFRSLCAKEKCTESVNNCDFN